MIKINQVAEFKSCLTCVYRKPYPAAMSSGQPVFYCFFCSLALDSNKDIVKPQEVCNMWKGVTLDSDQAL